MVPQLGRGHSGDKATEHPPGTVPQPSGAPWRPRSWGQHIWGLESMGIYRGWAPPPHSSTVPGCRRVPWCHSPPRCRRSCRWPGCRGLHRAGRRLPGTAAAASWWPGLGSGRRGGRGDSRYLHGQRDRRMRGWHRRMWNHRAPILRGPRGCSRWPRCPRPRWVPVRACTVPRSCKATSCAWPWAHLGCGGHPRPAAATAARCERKRRRRPDLAPGASRVQSSPSGPRCGQPSRLSSPRSSGGTSCGTATSPAWSWPSKVGTPRAHILHREQRRAAAAQPIPVVAKPPMARPPPCHLLPAREGVSTGQASAPFSPAPFLLPGPRVAEARGAPSSTQTRASPAGRGEPLAASSSSAAQEGARGMGAGCPGPPGCAAAVTQQRAGSSWREARSRWRFRSCGGRYLPTRPPLPRSW